MTRPAVLGCLLAVAFASPLLAQPPAPDVGATPGVQRAMTAAREHLKANRPAAAITVLEAEMLNAGGSPSFLDLLRGAYTARLRELEAQRADAGSLEVV